MVPYQSVYHDTIDITKKVFRQLLHDDNSFRKILYFVFQSVDCCIITVSWSWRYHWNNRTWFSSSGLINGITNLALFYSGKSHSYSIFKQYPCKNAPVSEMIFFQYVNYGPITVSWYLHKCYTHIIHDSPPYSVCLIISIVVIPLILLPEKLFLVVFPGIEMH